MNLSTVISIGAFIYLWRWYGMSWWLAALSMVGVWFLTTGVFGGLAAIIIRFLPPPKL